MAKTHDDEVSERGVHDGQRGDPLEDFIQGNITPISRDEKIYDKNYQYGQQHRYGSEGKYHTWGGSGANDPKSKEIKKSGKATRKEPIRTEEFFHRELEYCPACGDEYDGDYCYNCEDDYDDYDKEDELAWQKEQKKKVEEAEQKRRIIKEKTQGKHRMELENILLFEHDGDSDVKIAVINQIDVFSSYELEFSARYDDSYSVREAAKKRLKELNLSIPPEINFKHSPINRLNLGYLKLQAMYETDPAIKKYAGNKLEEYLNGPKAPIKNYLLRYKCTRCDHEWDSIDSSEKPESRCLLGCSNGDNHPSLLGLYKIIKGLVAGKEPFGYGKLIKSENLSEKCKISSHS